VADEKQVREGTRDDWLGDLLIDRAKLNDMLRFDHLRGKWLVWDGVRWRLDETRMAYDLLRTEADKRWNGLAEGMGNSERKMLERIYDTSKKESVLKGLSARDGIAMSGDEWDSDGYLVGFDNGVFDLQADRFRTGTPTQLWEAPLDSSLEVSKTVGYNFDPTAFCPTFDAFLDDIMGGDADLVAYLWRLIGYALIGTTREQKFWMWVGRGSNGKGVLARTLAYAFGNYAHKPSDSLYMRTKFGTARSDAARADLIDLRAVRFTYMSEPPGNQFDESMLKAHTGEDTITARALYSNHQAQFPPTHTIVFLTNEPPATDDVGVSMQRRVRVVKFERDYSGRPPLRVGNEYVDSGRLEDILKSERAGIIKRALYEARAWMIDGLPEPDKVLEWSKDYILDNDPMGQFIAERCEVQPGVQGSAGLLWAAYQDWCAHNSVDAGTQHKFGRDLGRKFDKVRANSGFMYKGIRSKNAMEIAEAEDE